jgi:hypothetical protein
LHNSTIIGEGTMKGSLVAANGSVIQVGLSSITGSRPLIYLDATTGVNGNTTFASGATFTPATSTSSADATAWLLRTGLGNQGTVIQGGAASPATLPTLRTTISGLTPGQQYQVYANYWDADGSTWRILAGATPTNLTLFDSPTDTFAGATDGIAPSTMPYVTQPLSTESNRRMWSGDLGQFVADSNGLISVFIDDFGGTVGDDRTWFDGVSFSSSQGAFTGYSTFVVEQNFTMDSISKLSLELGNMSSYDRLAILGSATFSGTLEVSLAQNGPTLELGDSFDILDFSNSIGQFSRYELPTLASGLDWDKSLLYTTGSLRVGVAVPEPGTLVLLASIGMGVWIRLRRQRTTAA